MTILNRPAVPQEPVAEARSNVDRLSAALESAEKEHARLRAEYDREMRDHIEHRRKVEPEIGPERAAATRVDAVKRLLADARNQLARVAADANDAHRVAAAATAGGRLADLTATAEAKLTAFATAIEEVRKQETDLFEALFSDQGGLKQPLSSPAAAQDAQRARHRLSRKAIEIARRGLVLVDARFEVDGECHVGDLERGLYRKPASLQG